MSALFFETITSPGVAGRCLQRLCVFQHNLFNLHTFRPWQYRRIWREMPPPHIGPTSRDTCSMVHLSEQCLKTGTQADTARHRAKKWRGGITWRHPTGISALFCRKKPVICLVSRLNQRIPLPDAGKCLKTVGLGGISVVWWHKFFWNEGKSYSKNRGLQHNKFGLWTLEKLI